MYSPKLSEFHRANSLKTLYLKDFRRLKTGVGDASNSQKNNQMEVCQRAVGSQLEPDFYVTCVVEFSAERIRILERGMCFSFRSQRTIGIILRCLLPFAGLMYNATIDF